jgi:hypothetical protein
VQRGAVSREHRRSWRRRGAATLVAGLAVVATIIQGELAAQARINGSVRYCDRHGRPHGCISVPKAARRPPAKVNQQGGRALTPTEVADGGGLGGGPSEGRETAIAWARTQLGKTIWAYRCERFIEEAYGTRYQFSSAWEAARHLTLRTGPIASAPRGALILFGPDPYNRGYGHVGISLGKGLMISALNTVRITNVARSRYWTALYRGWAEAPPTWPGRIPPAPAATGPLVSSRVQITAPAFASIVGGIVQLDASAENITGLQFAAYYATNPADATTIGWHVLGNATDSGDTWQLDWNTTSVPDQGDPLAGTVNVAAIALNAAGQTTGTRDYRRIEINNAAATGQLKEPAGVIPPSESTFAETTGGLTNTWTNYTNAGGTEGPQIPSNMTIQVTCALSGFRVADGNPWWYRVASSPWSGAYYAPADAFYNNGQTSGSLKGTPFVDPAVRGC